MAEVVLFGCGGVGLRLLLQISALKATTLRVSGVCDSRHFVTPRGRQFTAQQLQSIVETKQGGSGLDTLPSRDFKCSPKAAGLEDLQKQNLEHCIVADCSASDEIGDALGELVQKGAGVVLANKKPVTSTSELFSRLSADPRKFRCESTVGAGTPVITALNRIVRAGDPVKRIMGAMSGTLGYVMSGLEEGKAFSDVVAEAKKLGYTEPDPRDDLSGTDVARKALILARHLGWDLDMADVEIESLYPANLSNITVDQFMGLCPPNEPSMLQVNAPMSARVSAAKAEGKVLRYVATVEDRKCKVGLQAVPKSSPLGQLQGTDNMFVLDTGCFDPDPLVIQGRGAGTDATANGVLADILDIQDCMNFQGHKPGCTVA